MTGAALEQLDLSAVVAAIREQEAAGHTAESDRETPIGKFADKLQIRTAELGDALRPGNRQNLDVAYRRCAREAALAISTMRRIRFEQESRSTDQ